MLRVLPVLVAFTFALSACGSSGTTQGDGDGSGVDPDAGGEVSPDVVDDAASDVAEDGASDVPDDTVLDIGDDSTDLGADAMMDAGDEVERCERECERWAECDEVADACEAGVLSDFVASCEIGCADDMQRDPVLALVDATCAEVADVVLSEAPLDEACTTDLCADVVCDVTQTCNRATGMCESPAGCLDDGLEPNPDRDSATPLESADVLIEDLTICGADDDWFELTLPANEVAVISIRFTHADGDLDMELFTTEMTSIRTSLSVTDSEWLLAEATDEPTTFFIQVYGFGMDQNEYSLQVEMNPTGLCEINGDCPVDGEVCDRSFRCEVPPPCMDNFDCPFREECDVDSGLCFLPPCMDDSGCPFGEMCDVATGECNPPCASSEECMDGTVCYWPTGECVEPCAEDMDCTDVDTCDTMTGECVHLCTSDAECSGDVCNRVSGECEPFVCSADSLEPNETEAEGVPVTGPLYEQLGLTICEMDEDWFSINLPARSSLLIRATFADDVGDIEMSVLTAGTMDPIASSSSSSDNESIGIPAVGAPRSLSLRVYGFSDAENQYDLSVEFDPPGEICNSNDDCSSGFVCDANLCGRCSSTAQCAFREICITETGLCEPTM